jgi:hypothetical protein
LFCGWCSFVDDHDEQLLASRVLICVDELEGITEEMKKYNIGWLSANFIL